MVSLSGDIVYTPNKLGVGLVEGACGAMGSRLRSNPVATLNAVIGMLGNVTKFINKYNSENNQGKVIGRKFIDKYNYENSQNKLMDRNWRDMHEGWSQAVLNMDGSDFEREILLWLVQSEDWWERLFRWIIDFLESNIYFLHANIDSLQSNIDSDSPIEQSMADAYYMIVIDLNALLSAYYRVLIAQYSAVNSSMASHHSWATLMRAVRNSGIDGSLCDYMTDHVGEIRNKDIPDITEVLDMAVAVGEVEAYIPWSRVDAESKGPDGNRRELVPRMVRGLESIWDRFKLAK